MVEYSCNGKGLCYFYCVDNLYKYKWGISAMKKIDISNLIVSKIHDVYSYTLKEDTEGSAVSGNSMLIQIGRAHV